MVPGSPASRFSSLVALVDGLTFAELDRLAGAKSQGHAKQIAAGKEPRADAVSRYAAVLGAKPSYLLFGEGEAPSDRTVRAAVKRAREAAGARAGARAHAPKVRARSNAASGARVQRSRPSA